MEPATLWTIIGVIVAMGTPVIAFLWSLSDRFGSFESSLNNIKDDTEEIKEDLKDLKNQVNLHETRLCVVENNFNINKLIIDKFAPANSPRKINPLGHQLIKESGVWRIIENHRNIVTEHFRHKRPTNMYDAQEDMFKLVQTIYNKYQEEFDGVKDYAFRQGLDFNLILLLAGLKLRDDMFPKIGFKVDLLDK